ncbi:uncharacterized protein TNCV_3761871 [Trichonephila clavipes]|nr:uncharacterized protein TNCV_3761871 [Trichonephila clavipes]
MAQPLKGSYLGKLPPWPTDPLYHCRDFRYGPEHKKSGCHSLVMSSRKQRPAFDQVSEFNRGRIVAYRDCGLSFREIGSRVGRNQTTVMRICDR